MSAVARKGGDMDRSEAAKGRPQAGRAGSRPGPGRAALAVGFAFGAAFGLALGAVAFFTGAGTAPDGVLDFAIRVTGHGDIAEDLIWLFSGGFIGAMLATYAAWRADRRRADGIGKEHVINRTFRVLEGGPTATREKEPSPNGESGSR